MDNKNGITCDSKIEKLKTELNMTLDEYLLLYKKYNELLKMLWECRDNKKSIYNNLL